jgi:hypothetical protein
VKPCLHYYAWPDLWNDQQRAIKEWRFVPETLADFKVKRALGSKYGHVMPFHNAGSLN